MKRVKIDFFFSQYKKINTKHKCRIELSGIKNKDMIYQIKNIKFVLLESLKN